MQIITISFSLEYSIWIWFISMSWVFMFIVSASVNIRSLCSTEKVRILISDRFLSQSKKISFTIGPSVLALCLLRTFYFAGLFYGFDKQESRACTETLLLLPSIQRSWQLLAVNFFAMFYSVLYLTGLLLWIFLL